MEKEEEKEGGCRYLALGMPAVKEQADRAQLAKDTEVRGSRQTCQVLEMDKKIISVAKRLVN